MRRTAAAGAAVVLAALAGCGAAGVAPPVVDAHVHADFHLPGEAARWGPNTGTSFDAAGLRGEMERLGVRHLLVITPTEGGSASVSYAQVGVLLALQREVPGLHLVLGVHPEDPPREEDLALVDRWALERAIVGLKLYLGYDGRAPTDPAYEPYLRLAERRGLPVILHTGDTSSADAALRHAHPLGADELAVRWRGIQFVLAHLGNPWTLDAAEVVYKNPNVSVDLSGLVVGGPDYFQREERGPGFADLRRRVAEAFAWVEDPSRFLYGSDWPLVPMGPYLRLVASAIPEEHHRAVFHDNAVRLFRLDEPALAPPAPTPTSPQGRARSPRSIAPG